MRLRKNNGVMLGLVAVCVIVIIVLGVGFFTLALILGGGREIANATDAGALTVARRAMSPSLINVTLNGAQSSLQDSDWLPVNDFIALDPNNDGNGRFLYKNTSCSISMININRVVAQAVIVAINAQELNTPTATAHAQSVANAAVAVSTQLRSLLTGSQQSGGALTNEFARLAHSNNTKMFKGNRVELDGTSGLQSSFLRSGFSTNVYVPDGLISALPVTPPSNLTNQNPHQLRGPANGLNGDPNSHPYSYMAGYVNFNIPLNGGATRINLAGVPIFPSQKPHLIDIGEFDAAAKNAAAFGGAPFPSGTYLPPNAFRANAQTLVSYSSSFGGAVACALVGSLDSDFQAGLPMGYIRITNGPDAAKVNPPLGDVPDGTNDVFNNELWPPNGALVTNNGIYALSSSAGAEQWIVQWIAYNSGVIQQQPSSTPPAGVYKIRQGGGYTTVSSSDPPLISNILFCDANNIWDYQPGSGCFPPKRDGSTPASGSLVSAIEAQDGITHTRENVSADGFTAIEYQKAKLLEGAGRDAYCTKVERVTGANASGMKVFDTSACYAYPYVPMNFGKPGTPMQYIDQILHEGHGRAPHQCKQSLITAITRRMQEVDPSLKEQDVVAALSSPPANAQPNNPTEDNLQLGETLYLYSPGPGKVQLYLAPNPQASNLYFNPVLQNDGQNSAVSFTCAGTYDIAGRIVDARKTGGGNCPRGDAHYHEQPYVSFDGMRSIAPNDLTGTDSVLWVPASGWRNLLGDIKFSNTADKAGTFCRPN